MSGGSYDYIYSRLLSQCDGCMYDEEMNDMIRDLAEVLHDLEWWKSGDISEWVYRQTLAKFKEKWFEKDRCDRLKGYIDEQIGIVKRELYAMIGDPQEREG